MNRSEKIEQVSASLFAVHRDLILPKKDAKGQVRGRSDYRYLSLPALIDHLRPKLKDAQLYVTQEVAGGDGFVQVWTCVWHLSGQYVEFGPTFMPSHGDAQQAGSATTYARRYSLAAVFNLAADEDDDGVAALSPSRAAAATAGLPPAKEAPVDPKPQGEGGKDAAGASPYLSPQEQRQLADRLGIGRNDLLKYARTKYGERIRRLDDLTHEMEKELSP